MSKKEETENKSLTGEEIKALPKVHMVYAGRRVSTRKGKKILQHVWYHLNDEGTDVTSNTFLYYGKRGSNLKSTSIGCDWLFPSPNEGGTVYSGYATSDYTYPFKDLRDKWSMLDRAAYLELEVDMKAAKEARRRFDIEKLEPVRSAYRRMNSRQRAAFLAWVITYITGADKDR